jgi:hypothetical protein
MLQIQQMSKDLEGLDKGMLDKYNRARFMTTISTTTYVEKDMVSNNWDLFEIKRPVTFDSIKSYEIQRPDLLSLRIYGTFSYWWVLAKINEIDDVYNDMTIGQDIIVVDKNDILDWVHSVRSRQRK